MQIYYIYLCVFICTDADLNIIQPPVNNFVINFIPNKQAMLRLVCALDDIIPFGVTVTWLRNDNPVMIAYPNEVLQIGSTTTLIIRNPQPLDAGIYQCVFNNYANGWTLRRNIIVGR